MGNKGKNKRIPGKEDLRKSIRKTCSVGQVDSFFVKNKTIFFNRFRTSQCLLK